MRQRIATSELDLAQLSIHGSLEIEIPSLRDHNKKMEERGEKDTRIRINNIPSERFVGRERGSRGIFTRLLDKENNKEKKWKQNHRGGGSAGKVETRVTQRGTKLHRSRRKKEEEEEEERYDTANNNIQYFIRSSFTLLLTFHLSFFRTRVHETKWREKKRRKRKKERKKDRAIGRGSEREEGKQRGGGIEVRVWVFSGQNQAERGLKTSRRERRERRGREWKDRRGRGIREGVIERGGQRGDTTRVVHPVLDDEQVGTRTTTASYPRPPDRSINGEIDAFSAQTDRVRGMLGRTSIFHPAGGDHVHLNRFKNWYIVGDILYFFFPFLLFFFAGILDGTLVVVRDRGEIDVNSF